MNLYTRWMISTRVLSSLLNRINKFDVSFVDPIKFYSASISKFKEINIKIDDSSSHSIMTKNHFGATSNFSRFPHFFIASGELDQMIISSVDTDVVFYSAPFIQDLRIIKILLEAKKRVLLGGTCVIIYGIKEIRKTLVKIGLDEKLLDNLCIVNGYVDLTTNLYDIYKRWEDVDIKENNFNTLWDCKEDYSLNNFNIYRKLFNTHLGLVLDTSCWWGKCKYCTFPCVPVIDFTLGLPTQDVINKIINIANLYKSNNIYFFDSYMRATKRNKEIMFQLKENGFKLSIYSGVHLINKNYIDFLNKAEIDPFMGVETHIDSSLKEIDKGYKSSDIDNTFKEFLMYLDKKIRPVICLMADLPILSETKEKAITEIKNNYDYFKQKLDLFKKEGMSNGMGFQPDLKMLRHLPKNTIASKGGLIREASDEEFNINDLVGLWAVYLYMSKASGIKIDKFDKFSNIPITRFLPNGERLESDLYFVDKEIIKEFSTWI